jgi:hypothetical protein
MIHGPSARRSRSLPERDRRRVRRNEAAGAGTGADDGLVPRDGFQTTVGRTKRRYNHGEETDRFAVPPVAAADAEPWVRDQASQIRDAPARAARGADAPPA